MTRPTVGVLAVQGGFAAHLQALEQIGVRGVPVRFPHELTDLDGLVLPGGESTTQRDLLERLDMFDPLQALADRGLPILATCAGLILAAARVEPAQRSFGWLDVDVSRNAYGRQLDSFATRDDSGEVPLVFIRAPKITRVGEGVEVLARHRGEAVLVRQGAIVGATFHPELTDARAIHAACFVARGSSNVCSSAKALGPLGDERGVLKNVEEQLPHRSEHVGG